MFGMSIRSPQWRTDDLASSISLHLGAMAIAALVYQIDGDPRGHPGRSWADDPAGTLACLRAGPFSRQECGRWHNPAGTPACLSAATDRSVRCGAARQGDLEARGTLVMSADLIARSQNAARTESVEVSEVHPSGQRFGT